MILRQKDKFELEVRQMQEQTEELENTYKELLLLNSEFKVIKKNEMPSTLTAAADQSTVLSPQNAARSQSDNLSMMSQELEMMMNVPDDDYEDQVGGGADVGPGGMYEGDFYEQDAAGRHDTLTSSKRGSVTDDEMVGIDPVKQQKVEQRRRNKAANATGKNGCGQGDEACCVIF